LSTSVQFSPISSQPFIIILTFIIMIMIISTFSSDPALLSCLLSPIFSYLLLSSPSPSFTFFHLLSPSFIFVVRPFLSSVEINININPLRMPPGGGVCGTLLSLSLVIAALVVGVSIAPPGWYPTLEYWTAAHWSEYPSPHHHPPPLTMEEAVVVVVVVVGG